MVGQQEQFIGNILFYDYLLSKRNPTFLNRNLTRALQLHRQELESLSDPSQPQSPYPVVNRARWKFPSSEAFHKMSEDEEASKAFVLEIKGIEPLKPEERSWGRPAKKKGPLFRLEVDVQITLVEHKSMVECKKLPQTNVTMIGIHSENGKDVSLGMPRSKIKLKDLLQIHESSWRKGDPKDWDLLVTINFRETKDAEEFYIHMASSDSALHRNAPTRLRMQWRHIQECPEEDTVQPLTATINSSNGHEQLDFGLRLRMYWMTGSGGSTIATYNQQLNQSLQASQYPTPPPQRQTPNGGNFELTFVFADKSLTRRGLKCPHDSCKKRSFPRLDDLHMHLETFHDMFKHKMRKERETNGVQYWVCTCDVAEHRANQQRASNAAPDPRDIRLIRPKSPFNQREFLTEGNDDFQKTARQRRVGKSVVQRPVSAEPKAAIPRRHPDEVQERTQLERKTYKVPKAPPDVTFFRSISKRPLREGEYISESDDEVEMDWVQRKKDAQVATDPNMSEANKRLLRIFDPFMREERLQDDYHVGDALVRFARAKGASLWRDEIVDEFRSKLTELLEDDIISKDIHGACLRIVINGNPAESPTEGHPTRSSVFASLDRLNGSSRPTRIDIRKGRARITETGQITPQTADSDGDVEMRDAPAITGSKELTVETPPYDQCLCGGDALSSHARPFVLCESILCIRHAFHIDCVTKYWKPAQPPDSNDFDWTCNDCR